MKKYDGKIYFKEDLVKEYAASRKNISDKEAADLIRCTLAYLKHCTKDPETYAIYIAGLGYLYKDFKKEAKGKTLRTINTKFDLMMLEMMQPKESLLQKKPQINQEKAELQQWQNSGE